MTDIFCDAKEQIRRVDARLAQLAADYARSEMKRDLWLKAGKIQNAREVSRRLRQINAELAYLASQKRLGDCAAKHAPKH